MFSTVQKRSHDETSQDFEEDDEHARKRFRHESITSSSSAPLEQSSDHPVAHEHDEIDICTMPEPAPRQLLSRSIALVLGHVGFAGAQREALESFADSVESYIDRLIREATSSMQVARRRLPVVQDFEYALERFHVPRLSIEPHLRPPVQPLSTKYEVLEAPQSILDIREVQRLLGEELSGKIDKERRQFIPRNFPSFPSKHTYRFTQVATDYKRDMRKVREEAAVVARQGEEALRKIMKVGKSVQEKNMTRTANKSPRAKRRHDLWELAMQELQREMPAGKLLKEDDHCMMVNSGSQYWRMPLVRNTMKSQGIGRGQ